MIKKLLFVVLSVCMLLTSTHASSIGEKSVSTTQKLIEQASFHVDSVSSLIEALETAQDGDIIAVDTTIRCENYDHFEFSTNKKLTLVCTFDYFPMFIIFENTKISGFTIYGAYYSETIFISSGNVIVEDCTFYGNNEKLSQSIYAYDGSVAIKYCRFQDAIFTQIAIQEKATANIERCVLINNRSRACGGAIWNSGTLSVVDSIVANNQGEQGGGICNVGTLAVDNCVFWNNASVTAEGADIFNQKLWPEGGILTIRGEYGDAGFFDENTDEKIDLPLESYAGHLELVFISAEEPDLSGFEDEEDITHETPQQPMDSEDQSRDNDDLPQELPTKPSDGQEQLPLEGDDEEQGPPIGEDEGQEPPYGENENQEPSTAEDDTTRNDIRGPQEPPTNPSQDSNSSGNDVHWWPPTFSTPSTSTVPEDEDTETTVDDVPDKDTPKDKGTETPADDIPHEDVPKLVCGSAVIDTSKTIVLIGYGDNPVTRAQLANIIFCLLTDESIAIYSGEECSFTDIAPDSWYAPYVQTIGNAGIVYGVGAGQYAPDGLVTWAQIITILSRFVEVQSYELQNISYNGWAQAGIETAVARGWIEDQADFDPDTVMGRVELIQFINSVLKLYRV